VPKAEDEAGVPLPDGETRPICYGDPSCVCPKDDEGIIQPQPDCVSCTVVRSCLQEALRKEGLISDATGQSQLVSKATRFLKRWSDRKRAHTDSRDHSTPA
jgi:hypothetical protein